MGSTHEGFFYSQKARWTNALQTYICPWLSGVVWEYWRNMSSRTYTVHWWLTFYISERTWGLNIGTHCPSKNRQEPLFVPLVLSVRYATDGKHQETTLESGCILCKTGALYQSSCPLPDQKQLIGTMCRLAVSLLYTQGILFTSRFSASLWFFPVYPRLLDTNTYFLFVEMCELVQYNSDIDNLVSL